jgi:hypothetical protein
MLPLSCLLISTSRRRALAQRHSNSCKILISHAAGVRQHRHTYSLVFTRRRRADACSLMFTSCRCALHRDACSLILTSSVLVQCKGTCSLIFMSSRHRFTQRQSDPCHCLLLTSNTHTFKQRPSDLCHNLLFTSSTHSFTQRRSDSCHRLLFTSSRHTFT